MKQLFITSATSYPSAATDVMKLATGQIEVLENGVFTKAALGKVGFASVLVNRGADNQPLIMDEIDLHTLTVTKTDYVAGTKFKATLTVPNTVVGEDYTVVIAMKGKGFNERNKWTYTERATATTAATMATTLAKYINNGTVGHGIKATVSSATITLDGQLEGVDYAVLTDDALTSVKATVTTAGKAAIADKAWVQDLAQICSGGKGFNYQSEEDASIYPGHPEVVAAAQYVVYNLRFANPRRGAKTRDEVVNQELHIAVPKTATAVITALDTILMGAADDM